MKRYLILAIMFSTLAHMTVAGSLIYMPYQFYKVYKADHTEDSGGIIWGVMQDKAASTGGERYSSPYRSGVDGTPLAFHREIRKVFLGGRGKKSEVSFVNRSGFQPDQKSPESPETSSGGGQSIPGPDSDQFVYLPANQDVDGSSNRSLDVPAKQQNQGQNIFYLNQEIWQSGGDSGCNEISHCTGKIASGDHHRMDMIGSGYSDNGISKGALNGNILGRQWPGYGEGGNGINGFLEHIRREIERHKYYPASARENDIEGTVYINFYVKGNGKIDEIAIGKSSGFKILDESAIRTVKSIKQISILPSLGEGIEEVDITVPITYRLEEESK